MPAPSSVSPGAQTRTLRPPRDWILLPAVASLTVVALLIALEAAGTWVFPRTGAGVERCLTSDATGVHGIPNAVCRHRLAEGDEIEYRLNDCGDRTPLPCTETRPTTYNIVTVGSSIVFGYGVRDDLSWPELLAPNLSRLTGRKVRLYNKGMVWVFPRAVAAQFDATLARKPDLILWLLMPLDLWDPPVPDLRAAPKSPAAPPGFGSTALRQIETEFALRSVPHALNAIWEQSRSALLLKHFLYKSESLYVNSVLVNPEEAIKVHPDPLWPQRLSQFESYYAQIQAKSQAAGVPFFLVLLPNRGQADLISIGQWPASVDPFRTGNDLRAIASRRAGTFIDLSPRFRSISNPGRYYLPVDGHLYPSGHALVARMLAEELAKRGVVR